MNWTDGARLMDDLLYSIFHITQHPRLLERIQYLNDMPCPFNEPLHYAQLAT